MRIDNLKFDNGNNAAISMQVLGELARRGEVTARATYHVDHNNAQEVLTITLANPITKR